MSSPRKFLRPLSPRPKAFFSNRQTAHLDPHPRQAYSDPRSCVPRVTPCTRQSQHQSHKRPRTQRSASSDPQSRVPRVTPCTRQSQHQSHKRPRTQRTRSIHANGTRSAVSQATPSTQRLHQEIDIQPPPYETHAGVPCSKNKKLRFSG